MRRPCLLVLSLALAAGAEPAKGTVHGDHKGGRYSMHVPSDWSVAEGAKYGLWITSIPPSHTPKDYVNLWVQSRSATPHISLIVDAGVTTDQFLPLIEKLRGEYGFDMKRVCMAAYGEGVQRALKFMGENPDALAACVLIQGLTPPDYASAAGRPTPVLFINDVGCTYARIGDAHSLESSMKDMGYDVTFWELNDPPNKDQWPSSQMGKIFEWANGLKPFDAAAIFAAAADALKPDAKPESWRAALQNPTQHFFRLLGDGMSPGLGKARPDCLSRCFRTMNEVVRENRPAAKSLAVVVATAKIKKLEGGSLLVCETGDVETAEDSVIYCTGELKVGKLTRCLVFSAKDVTVGKEMKSSLVFTPGKFKAAGILEDSTLLALGGAEGTAKAKENWFVNTAERKIKGAGERVVTRKRLPGAP